MKRGSLLAIVLGGQRPIVPVLSLLLAFEDRHLQLTHLFIVRGPVSTSLVQVGHRLMTEGLNSGQLLLRLRCWLPFRLTGLSACRFFFIWDYFVLVSTQRILRK